MPDDQMTAMFDAEHDALRELASGLTPEQWVLSSLCDDWTVGDVIAHATFHTHRTGLRGTVPSAEKVMPRLIEREHAETQAGIVAWLGRPAPDGAPTKVNVCELVIHQEDIRRVLDLPRRYPDDTMHLCLDHCTGWAGRVFVLERRKGLEKGLTLVATDLDWRHGRGPEVRGPAAALLMAIGARPSVLADLDGPGVATIADRLGVGVGATSSAT